MDGGRIIPFWSRAAATNMESRVFRRQHVGGGLEGHPVYARVRQRCHGFLTVVLLWIAAACCGGRSVEVLLWQMIPLDPEQRFGSSLPLGSRYERCERVCQAQRLGVASPRLHRILSLRRLHTAHSAARLQVIPFGFVCSIPVMLISTWDRVRRASRTGHDDGGGTNAMKDSLIVVGGLSLSLSSKH